jgi:hypothetical protein
MLPWFRLKIQVVTVRRVWEHCVLSVVDDLERVAGLPGLSIESEGAAQGIPLGLDGSRGTGTLIGTNLWHCCRLDG